MKFNIIDKELKEIEAYLSRNPVTPPSRISKKDSKLPHTLLVITDAKGQQRIGVKSYGKEDSATLGKGNFGKVQIFQWLDQNKDGALRLTNSQSAVKIAEVKGNKAKNELSREIKCSTIFFGPDHIQTYSKRGRKNKPDKEYLIMPFLEGKDLRKVLKSSPKLPPDEIKIIILSLIQNVNDMHQKGIMHLDIHPGNILYNKNAQSIKEKVSLLDLGRSKLLDNSNMVNIDSERQLGSIRYAHPKYFGGVDAQQAWLDIVISEGRLQNKLKKSHHFLLCSIKEMKSKYKDDPSVDLAPLELLEEYLVRNKSNLLSANQLSFIQDIKQWERINDWRFDYIFKAGAFFTQFKDAYQQCFDIQNKANTLEQNINSLYPMQVGLEADYAGIIKTIQELCAPYQLENKQSLDDMLNNPNLTINDLNNWAKNMDIQDKSRKKQRKKTQLFSRAAKRERLETEKTRNVYERDAYARSDSSDDEDNEQYDRNAYARGDSSDDEDNEQYDRNAYARGDSSDDEDEEQYDRNAYARSDSSDDEAEEQYDRNAYARSDSSDDEAEERVERNSDNKKHRNDKINKPRR